MNNSDVICVLTNMVVAVKQMGFLSLSKASLVVYCTTIPGIIYCIVVPGSIFTENMLYIILPVETPLSKISKF